MKTCTACSLYAPDSVDYCAKCGHQLATAVDSPGESKATCPQCKLSVPAGATRCGHCGQGIGTIHTVGAVIQLLLILGALYFLWRWWTQLPR